jgi:nuclear cap-binding protein subunit 1
MGGVAHKYHDAAQSVLDDLRARRDAGDVLAHVRALSAGLVEGGLSTEEADDALRSVSMQALLHVGARSFSHLLNALERYLPLLRALGGRAELLRATARFWRAHAQMVGVVADKLVQYQVVDPADVVAFVFEEGAGIDAERWDLLRGALDKAHGRVARQRRLVAQLRKEDEESRAAAKAKEGAMEVDVDVKPGPCPASLLVRVC